MQFVKGIVGRIIFLHTSFVCIKFDIGPPLLYTLVFMRFLAPSFVDCWNCLKLPHSKTGLTIHIPGKPYAYSSFTYQTLTGIYKFTISKSLHMNFITILILLKLDMHNRSTIYYIQYICIYIQYSVSQRSGSTSLISIRLVIGILICRSVPLKKNSN